MTVTVRIPTTFSKITGGTARVNESGDTVRAVLDSLVTTYPELRDRIYDEDARVRRFINLFVGEEDVRFLDGLDTPLSDGAELSIVPAVAGGSGR